MFWQTLKVLETAGLEPDAEQIAAAVWLAQFLPEAKAERETDGRTADNAWSGAGPVSSVSERPGGSPTAQNDPAIRKKTTPSAPQSRRLFPSVPVAASPTKLRASEVTIPAPLALAHSLPLARALRPLKQRFSRPTSLVLSEEKTVTATAECGALTLIFEPHRLPWFDEADIVVEDSPSMALWSATGRQVTQLVERLGAFRKVNRWRLRRDGDGLVLVGRNGLQRPARTAFGDGTPGAVFIVSDGVSPIWRDASAARVLSSWGRHVPVVLFQVLSPRLWYRTGLGMPDTEVSALRAGTPNQDLTRISELTLFHDESSGDATTVLPVVPIAPRSLGEWAAMVTGGSARCAAYLLSTQPGEPTVPDQPAGPPDDSEIERRLGQFLGSVSPDTARLAVYLSAVSPTPSIARIIQRALLPETGPAELAEVFLSGLIRRTTPHDDDCDPDHVLYDFVGNVADQLRSRLRFSVEQKVAEVVSNDLAKRFGLPAESLRVLVEDPSGTETVDARLQHFAEYRRATQTRMSTAAQVAEPTATETPNSEPDTVIERDNVTDASGSKASSSEAAPLTGALRNGYPPFATVLSGDAVVGQGLLVNGNFVVIHGSLATHYENQGLQVALRSPDNTMKTFRVGHSLYAVTEPDLAFLEIDTGPEGFVFWDEQITTLNGARQVFFAQTSVGLARNPFDFGLTYHEGKGVESDESRYMVELLEPESQLAPGALTLNDDGSFLGLALGMAEPSIVRVVSSHALLQALEAIRSNPTAEEETLTSGGYREDFLAVPIPLPGYRQTFSNINRLAYTHHTIDFDTGRRIALLAAANYDGGQRQSSERPTGFTLDERLPARQQLDLNSTRGAPVDRGHLIGRPEVDWGTIAEAHTASLDAFKAPNVAPQFKELNRRTLIELDKWLEELIGGGRASIFVGPVYNPGDPIWRGMVVPQAFWKIVAWQADPDAEPRALGFILPHRASVDGDEIAFSDYRHPAHPLEHLAPIGEIADLARLYLNELERLDCIEDFRLPASAEQSGQDAGAESDGAPEDAAKFVEGADLDSRSAETSAGLPQPDYTQAIDQTVAVGSNLVEIAAKVPPELRPMVVNTFLIAQMTADRKVADTSESFLAWWETYIDVLQKTGWVIESDNTGTKEMSGSMNEVREEVLPVIVTALGPTAVTSSPIVSLLESLDEGSEDTPWLKLFDRESRKVRGNQFGLSAVDYDDGHLRVRSFGFELEAERAVNQVLFFRSDQSKARLRHSHVSLRIGEDFLRQIAEPLSARLSQYTENKIADIQIDGRTDGAPIEDESPAKPEEGQSRHNIELERGRHIILIGSATYDHFADLPAVGDSLRMLDDLMQHLWPGSYIHTLLDEKLSTILDAVAKVAESAAPDDQIILYFSGHALTALDQSDPSRLCFSETDPDNVGSTSITPRDLLGALQRTPAGQIAVFVDLASSGPTLGFGNAEPLPSIESLSNDRQDVFILATKPEEMTTLPASGPSPFASTLAMGLSGAAGPSDDNLIETDTLYDFMRNELMSRYREMGQFDLPLIRYSHGKRAAFMVLGRVLDEDRGSPA